jgi:hypothetical protein
MRRLGVVLVIALLTGCSLLPPPTGIQVAIPALNGVPALPVTIVDHAGIVRAAAPGAAPDVLSMETAVHAIPGRDNAVLLTWIGGECDDRSIVTIDPDEGRYGVTIESPSSATSCSAVGIIRSVVLELTEPVGADAFLSP